MIHLKNHNNLNSEAQEILHLMHSTLLSDIINVVKYGCIPPFAETMNFLRITANVRKSRLFVIINLLTKM